MAKQVTIAGANRYCQSRLRAAKYNEDFSVRATAVNHLPGVTEESLKRYELDITKAPNIVVALMADAYNDPDLRLWYCSHECPLGRDCRTVEDMPPERTLIRLQNVRGTIESPSNSSSESNVRQLPPFKWVAVLARLYKSAFHRKKMSLLSEILCMLVVPLEQI